MTYPAATLPITSIPAGTSTSAVGMRFFTRLLNPDRVPVHRGRSAQRHRHGGGLANRKRSSLVLQPRSRIRHRSQGRQRRLCHWRRRVLPQGNQLPECRAPAVLQLLLLRRRLHQPDRRPLLLQPGRHQRRRRIPPQVHRHVRRWTNGSLCRGTVCRRIHACGGQSVAQRPRQHHHRRGHTPVAHQLRHPLLSAVSKPRTLKPPVHQAGGFCVSVPTSPRSIRRRNSRASRASPGSDSPWMEQRSRSSSTRGAGSPA